MVEPAGWWCKVHGQSTIICDEHLSAYDRTSCDSEPTFTRTNIRKAWEEFAKERDEWIETIKKHDKPYNDLTIGRIAGVEESADEARRKAREW